MTRPKSLVSSPHLLVLLLFFVFSFTIVRTALGFQSDELLADDEEFGLEGGRVGGGGGVRSPPDTPSRNRRRGADSDLDSKVQFSLEHAFGDSDFTPAGTFSARLKTSSHGGQTLTKLRFSRPAFTETEKQNFRKLLEEDDFYRIRLPSNVLNSPGREYAISSVKARCLPRDGLDEHFVIHTDGVNILGVNYGSPASCPYPRQLKVPTKWSFNSHTILKSRELAPRTPVFTEDTGAEAVEGEAVNLPEKSFWAKYWMYLIPLGLIVMNAITQAMNMADEQTGGQGTAQPPAAAVPRGTNTVARRR